MSTSTTFAITPEEFRTGQVDDVDQPCIFRKEDQNEDGVVTRSLAIDFDEQAGYLIVWSYCFDGISRKTNLHMLSKDDVAELRRVLTQDYIS